MSRCLRWVVLPLLLGPLGAQVVVKVPTAATEVWNVRTWKDPWKGRAVPMPTPGGTWVLTQRDAWWFDQDGIEPVVRRGCLPVPVDASTVAAPGRGGFWLYGAPDGLGFWISFETFQATPAPPFQGTLGPGSAGVVWRDQLHVLTADGSLRRLEDAGWVSLAAPQMVNRLGAYSSGFFQVGDRFLAFGDHHVASYDPVSDAWLPKADVQVVLRLRPSFGRGGLGVVDLESERMYVTLGMGTRSLGVADWNTRGFHHLRPRLPFPLDDPFACLLIQGPASNRRFVVCAPQQKQIASLPISKFERIASPHRAADLGSNWEVWNALPAGSVGELFRHADGFGNAVYLEPWVYTQRKNLVRRFHLDTFEFSENLAGHQYGESWIQPGAAMATDGESRVFQITGNDRILWVLETQEWARAQGGSALPDIKDMRVWQGPPLPTNPGRNTALLWHGDRLLLGLGPEGRTVWGWRPGDPSYVPVAPLPDDFPLDQDGLYQFVADGEDVLVISGSHYARLRPDGFTGENGAFSRPILRDGGMLALDPPTRKLYMVFGGGSRDAGLKDLPTGTELLFQDFLPDGVSVPGNRMFLAVTEGRAQLYLLRGSDTDELWRLPLVR